MSSCRTDQRWCRINQEKADKLTEKIPVDEEMQDLAEFIKVFGDPSRLSILFHLREEALCVHDLSQLTGMQQTAVSHQLKMLRQMRLVKYHKEGRMAVYSLNDSHISQILDIGLRHIAEEVRND
ncbi:MAG: metalloregulator ArsR/SmtB family transcription factor [Spirochaetales bacterium]|nr:metalloregulator ArsR/SmtB family transcription factor [Spirochaetales bacterium]